MLEDNPSNGSQGIPIIDRHQCPTWVPNALPRDLCSDERTIEVPPSAFGLRPNDVVGRRADDFPSRCVWPVPCISLGKLFAQLLKSLIA